MTGDPPWIEDLTPTVTAFRPYHHGGGTRRTSRQPVPERPCANCDTPFTPASVAGRYCTSVCRQTAKAVRYARSAIATHGQPLPPAIDEAIGIKIAHVLAGGYAEQTRRLPADVRAAVIARDHGRCVLCQHPGEEIDHANGDSNAVADLRLLCRRCHRRVTGEHLHRIPDGHPAHLTRQSLLARIHAVTPLRPCDAADWTQTWRTGDPAGSTST